MPLLTPRCAMMCFPGARIEKKAVSSPGIASTQRAVSGHSFANTRERWPKPRYQKVFHSSVSEMRY